MKKSILDTAGDNLHIGFTFEKIDRENRTVSGWATLDNEDSHGDTITADGTRRAFARFMGGIREMHQPLAVGPLISYEELQKYSPEDDKVYTGMHVTAKISKGAQNTWEKVLDGTLRGFSIGGKALQKRKKDDFGKGNIIEEYDLHEISLVDNPANPLATVLTVRKIGDSFVFNEDDIKKDVRHILYHPESGDVVLSQDESREGFENIGWTDSVEDTYAIRRALDDHMESMQKSKGFTLEADGNVEFRNGTISSGSFASGTNSGNTTHVTLKANEDVLQKDAAGAGDNTEGGANVATEEEKDTSVAEQGVEETTDEAGVVESADVTEVEEDDTEETEDDAVEKAADVAEVEDEPAVDVDAIVKAVTAAVTGAVAQSTEESKTAISEVQTSFEKTISDLKDELDAKLTKSLEGLASRVEAVESGTAIKKSADIVVDDDEADEDDGENDFWRGSGFLSTSDLTKVD